jgi:tRNA-uridine 2-sulfurtransferase
VRVLVAMSGGVDSSVAAALLVEQGYEVVGATLKLWGGDSDSGCCSVADVEDARRVAQQLGIIHHVFNLTEEFDRHVVARYVDEHEQGRTPNPCIECNRTIKFARLLRRSDRLGFDRLATGHHARVTRDTGRGDRGARLRLRRGADGAKDQSYVLSMLGQDELSRILFPVGEMTKDEVRHRAQRLGLRTAAKPDSQDVCFISKSAGRGGFLSERMTIGGGRLVTTAGVDIGPVEALEMLTIGQRRGLGLQARSRPERRYVVDVDLEGRTATIGTLDDLMVQRTEVVGLSWSSGSPPHSGTAVQAQLSAHGLPLPATWEGGDTPGVVVFDEPTRRVAPGQAVVLYDPEVDGGEVVLGGGTAV